MVGLTICASQGKSQCEDLVSRVSAYNKKSRVQEKARLCKKWKKALVAIVVSCDARCGQGRAAIGVISPTEWQESSTRVDNRWERPRAKMHAWNHSNPRKIIISSCLRFDFDSLWKISRMAYDSELAPCTTCSLVSWASRVAQWLVVSYKAFHELGGLPIAVSTPPSVYKRGWGWKPARWSYFPKPSLVSKWSISYKCIVEFRRYTYMVNMLIHMNNAISVMLVQRLRKTTY